MPTTSRADQPTFAYDTTNGLYNTTELVDDAKVTIQGILTDTQTGESTTFNLNLTFKLASMTIETAKSEIKDNGDLTITVTGKNLDISNKDKYEFTYIPNVPNDGVNSKVDSTTNPSITSDILEFDTSEGITNTSNEVHFIIKKFKEVSSNPSSTDLPTAQTKGLYGKTFTVALKTDNSSNTPEGGLPIKKVQCNSLLLLMLHLHL